MDALGPHGLATVIDLVDAISLGNPGIHLVVTDRPQVMRAELEERCPTGWVIEPLFAPERDRLSDAAYEEPGEQGTVLLDVVDSNEERERSALRALNTDREWLFGARKGAVILVAGQDAAKADAALLELQAQAPDLWSMKTRVHRAVGPDREQAARDEVLDLLTPRMRGDRALAEHWLDGRAFLQDWVKYRLWREGPQQDAWLALAEGEAGRASEDFRRPGLEMLKEPGARGPVWSIEPIGEAIEIDRWPRPAWPSGRVDPVQHALVTAMEAALDRDRMAELYVLPEDQAVERLNEAVLTLGLLRNSRYELVIHLDAREGLEQGIALCLQAAGVTDGEPGLVGMARRLQGALAGTEVLVLITEVQDTELLFLHAVMPGRAIVVTVRSRQKATFCVCGSERIEGEMTWAEARLSRWTMGSMRRELRPRTLPLDLRAALALARYGVLLVDRSWERTLPEAWHPVSLASERVVGFLIGDAAIPSALDGVQWVGRLALEDESAGDRLEHAVQALAGEPVRAMETHAHMMAPVISRPAVELSRAAAQPTTRARGGIDDNGEEAIGDQVIADRLARTIGDPQDARRVLLRAGFDPGHIRPFTGKPIVYWSDAVEDARNGINPGGVTALVEAAAKVASGELRIGLDAGYVALPENPAPSHYLVARFGVVEFTGRQRELEDLDAWTAQPKPVAVRLVHGPGGTGKTRLLLEWVEHRRTQGDRAWFLRDELSPAVVEWLCEVEQATVIVDYAETRAGLFELLRRLAPLRTDEGTQRVRVVLLARNSGDWWEALRQRDAGVETLLADSPLPLSIEPLVPMDERVAEFARAAACFATLHGQPTPTAAPPLDDPRFGRVLYLHMAALAAVEGLGVAAGQLLDELLVHERRFWLRRAELSGDGVGRDTVAEFLDAARAYVGAVTLRGGVPDVPEARALADRFSQEHRTKLVALARDLYPHAGDGWIGGLEPDLLGEALVRSLVMDRARPRWIDDAMAGADAAQWTSALTMLGRVEEVEPSVEQVYGTVLAGHAQDRALPAFDAVLALGERTAHSRLGIELAKALETEGTAELARSFDRRIPYPTTMLREVAVWVYEALLDVARDDETRARRLLSLGQRRSALGQRQEALDATQEAVALWTRLAQSHPEDFLPKLAHSLNNLGNAFEDVGRNDEALEASRRAVEIYRDLARVHPEDFRPYLATSLSNLGLRLSALGKREEAFNATRQSLVLRMQLVESDPEAFLPDLGQGLHNLGATLSALGRRKEALDLTRDAVTVYRTLAQDQPDAFLPEFARSLNSLSGTLALTGQGEEALRTNDEAIAVFRKLVEARSDAFLPDLARSLNNRGGILSKLGRRDEALEANREAVAVYRTLTRAHPDAFRFNLAQSLNNMGITLSALDRKKEALDATREAVALHRALAQANPDAFLPALARSLGAHGSILRALNRTAEADAAYAEALNCIWPFFEEHPHALAGLVGTLLTSRATTLGPRADEVLAPRRERYDELLSTPR